MGEDKPVAFSRYGGVFCYVQRLTIRRLVPDLVVRDSEHQVGIFPIQQQRTGKDLFFLKTEPVRVFAPLFAVQRTL